MGCDVRGASLFLKAGHRHTHRVTITIGSSFIGFFAGAYAAVKLGDLALKLK
jgi:hypothetical protein